MFEYNKLDEMLKNASLNYNTRPVEKFENYSPSEMSNILNHSFEDDSIINFRNDFSKLSFKDIPFFNSIKYFLSIINREGEIKLTASGNFPPKYVKELYNKNFIDDIFLEHKSAKTLKEMDVSYIHLTKVLCYVSKLVKTYKGSISLTRQGKNMLSNDFELLKTIYKNFYQNYNLSYMDEYPDFDFSQVFPFFILLVGKYGDKSRSFDFYYNKMINAFPALNVPLDLDEFIDYDTNTDFSKICKDAFEFRIIENFLLLFNFVTYNKETKILKKSYIFNELFLILPNNTALKNTSEKVM
jgi:hypothetical protein